MILKISAKCINRKVDKVFMTTWQRDKKLSLSHLHVQQCIRHNIFWILHNSPTQVKSGRVFLMPVNASLQVFVVIENAGCLIGVYFNLNWVTQWAVLVQTVERNFPWCFCFNCLSLDLGRILSSVNNADWEQVSPVTTLELWSPTIERKKKWTQIGLLTNKR